MQQPTLKIANARYILTMDGQRRIIRNGSVLVQGQRIARVGKAEELADVPADRTIDAGEMVLTPGFCNGHMHISYAHAVRGVFPDDLAPNVYLANVFRLQAAMTEEEEYVTSLLAITELVKHGTTCFLDPGSTKFLDACMQAYEESGCRLIVGAQVVDQPNPINLPVTSLDDAVARMEQTIRTYDHRLNDRVRAWAMPFSADYASPELLQAAKRLADQYQVGMTLHQVNRQSTVDTYLKTHGKRPVEYLEDLGVLGPNVLLAHVVGLNDAEVDALVRTETRAVVCPPATMKLGEGFTVRAQVPEMLEKGVCVGLGNDAANNSNLLDTLRAMYLAAIAFKDARQSTRMVPAETALEMATIRGAQALGLDADLGSIEPGKKADLVLFDTRRPEWRALHNPVNNLVYSADGRSVHTVVIDGRVVVEGGRALFVDQGKLIQKVQELGEALLHRAEVAFPPRWPIV